MKTENNFLKSFNPTKEDKYEISIILSGLTEHILKLKGKDDNIYAAVSLFSLSGNSVIYGNDLKLEDLHKLQAFIITKMAEDEKE